MTATAAPRTPAGAATPGAEDRPAPPPRRWWAVGLAVVAALVVAAAAGPRPPSVGQETAGDQQLAAAVREVVTDPTGFDTLVAAEVPAGGGAARTAGLGGADADTPFELGSITKALTGMLLADLVDDGVVAFDDTLAELLPDATFADREVGAITLEQLATHRSGLPRDLDGDLPRRFSQLFGGDPFGALAPQQVLDELATTSLSAPDRPTYSNLGFAVLGQTLAEATGTPYRDLLRERVLDPLAMTDTVVVAPGEPLPPGAGPGRSPGGTVMSAWRGWGMAPAGGAIWSTAGDLGRLLQGVADGTAPGAGAAEPRADYRDDSRIGLGWITTTHDDGREVTWHNGGTSGYRTWAGFDRATGRGVALLSSTGRGVDEAAEELLGVGAGESPGTDWRSVGITLFFTVMGAVSVLGAVPGRRGKGTPRDRLRAPVAVGSSAVLLWMAHLAGSWHVVPPAVWAAAVAVSAAGLVRALEWWPRLPWTAGGPRWRRLASGVLSLGVAVVVLGYLAWASV